MKKTLMNLTSKVKLENGILTLSLINEEQIEVGYIQGKLLSDRLNLEHTIVNENFQGLGLGSKLVELALEYAKIHQLKLVPICSYTKKYFTKHPEYKNLLINLD